MFCLLVRQYDSEGGSKGEPVLAHQVLPEGHTWGSKEDGDDGDPFCVVYVDNDPVVEEQLNKGLRACVSYPYAEWEPHEEVHEEPSSVTDEFVENTYRRVEFGGKRVPVGKIAQNAHIDVRELEEVPKSKEDNVIGLRPATTIIKRPKQVIKEM